MVVVDDGSTDGSAAAAEAAGASGAAPSGQSRQGRGAGDRRSRIAEKRGADAVLTMDADGQHDPGEIAAAGGGARSASRARSSSACAASRPRTCRAQPRRQSHLDLVDLALRRAALHRHAVGVSRLSARAVRRARCARRRFDTETELLLRAAQDELPLVEVPITTIYAAGSRHATFTAFATRMRVIKLVFFSPLWRCWRWLIAGWRRVRACAARRSRPTALPASTAVADDARRASRHRRGARPGRTRTLRGLIAVERPDRFRLRALGPAGITLFDVVSVGGEVQVIEAIKDPNASALGRDRAVDGRRSAGRLRSAAARRPGARRLEATRWWRRPTVRCAELGGVDARDAVPTRIDIENRARHYTVRVDVSERRDRRDAGSGAVGGVAVRRPCHRRLTPDASSRRRAVRRACRTGRARSRTATASDVHILADPLALTMLARLCAKGTVQPEVNRLVGELYAHAGARGGRGGVSARSRWRCRRA